jgi:hypothetical protein
MYKLSIALALLATSIASLAEELPLVADAHVSTAATASNYGGLPQLTVGNGSTALLTFDLGTLPVLVQAGTVAKATLILYVNRLGQTGRLDVAAVTTPWLESTVTYSTLPSITAISASSDAISQGNTVVGIDITALVQGWINAPFNPASLALTSTSGIFFLDSKESVSTSHPAYIEVSFAALAGPKGSKGDTGDAGMANSVAGRPGLQGLQGPVGSAGITGPSGIAGLQGAAGPQGPIGSQGDRGPLGPTGQPGPVGFSGKKGVVGNQGPAGATGTGGINGGAGANGAPGASGQTGSPGPRGPAGLTWYYQPHVLPGQTTGFFSTACPGNSIVMSGVCGDPADVGDAAYVALDYDGPDFSDIKNWKCTIRNTDSVARTIRYGALCTTAGATLVDFDNAGMATSQASENPGSGARSVIPTRPNGGVFTAVIVPFPTETIQKSTSGKQQ